MKSRFHNISLKILAPLILVFITSFIVITVFVVRSQVRFAREQLIQNAKVSTQSIVTGGLDVFIEGNSYDIQSLLVNAKRANDMIAYILIVDKRGKVLAHTDVLLIDEMLTNTEFDRTALAIREFTVRTVPNNKDLFEVCTPMLAFGSEKEILGLIRVGINQRVVRAKIRQIQSQLMLLGLVTVVMSIILFVGIVNRVVNKPVKLLTQGAEQVSSGNLEIAIPVKSHDEISYLSKTFNQMAKNLNSLIGQIQRSGIQVTSSATELSATAKQQEAVVMTHLESTNKMLNSIQEISDVAADLVATMQRVVSMSQETAEFANSGQMDLARMEEAMQHMENASETISSRLHTIREKARNITDVVTTITKVADQTNLLSLNAAIEAEKAGEYGRGFTVVAREIRRLADQTAVATLDIEQMVQEMQAAVSAGVEEVDKFIAEIRHSAEDVGKISTQLTRIIEQVQALSPNFEEVNVAVGHQSEYAQEIRSAMRYLSEEMRQTKESLHETYAAIEQLNTVARGLQNEVSRFKAG